MTQTQRSRELARETERERCKPNKIHTQERERETKRKIVIVAFICCTTERRIVVIEEERGQARVGESNYRRRGAWHSCEDRLRRWPVKAENRRGRKGRRDRVRTIMPGWKGEEKRNTK